MCIVLDGWLLTAEVWQVIERDREREGGREGGRERWRERENERERKTTVLGHYDLFHKRLGCAGNTDPDCS